jgi:uncharacterized glyoxalase superfamily protein PhnB
MLESRDIQATIEFYTNILGFTLEEELKHEGVINWCDLSRDGVSIMFCMPNTHMNYGSILLTGSLYITVEQVDEVWESLKDKCHVLYALENFHYGMREFAIQDNNGYVINFGEPIDT